MFANAANAISESRPSHEVERFGFEAARRALTRPVYWIVKNAGKEPTSVLDEMQGFNLSSIGFAPMVKRKWRNTLSLFRPTRAGE